MIKIKGIKKSYDERLVLNIEELTLEENKIYAIMGANGCGKSTLLKSIMGLVTLDYGEVVVGDKQDIHYMPQSPYIFKGSVRQNLFCVKIEQSCIEKSDFEMMLDKEATTLSGGEKQKMLLLRAILQDKKILLLDEPTSDMDVCGTIAYEELLKEYQQQSGALIIIVTHSLAQATRLADRLLFMKDGCLVEQGDCLQLIKDAKTNELNEFIKFHQV